MKTTLKMTALTALSALVLAGCGAHQMKSEEQANMQLQQQAVLEFKLDARFWRI